MQCCLRPQEHDTNVIVVDWSEGASRIFYPQSASNTRVVGYCSGYLANHITNLASVHCIGHSLGGQTCGSMGYSVDGVMGRATGQFKVIFCIDPLLMKKCMAVRPICCGLHGLL